MIRPTVRHMSRTTLAAILGLVCITNLTSCYSMYAKPELARLSILQDRVHEYGSVTASSFLVAPTTTNNPFAFELGDAGGPRAHYAAAGGLQGASASLNETSFRLGTVRTAQADPTQTLAYNAKLGEYAADTIDYERRQRAEVQAARLRELAVLAAAKETEDPATTLQALANAKEQTAARLGPEERPDFPTAAAENNVPPLSESLKPADNHAAKRLSADKLTEIGQLIAPDSFGINNRAKLMAAAGDTAVEGILRVLGNPKAYIGGEEGKGVLFGVGMISVKPGWRTRENYSALVTLHPRLVYKPARDVIVSRCIEQTRKELGTHTDFAVAEGAEAQLKDKAEWDSLKQAALQASRRFALHEGMVDDCPNKASPQYAGLFARLKAADYVVASTSIAPSRLATVLAVSPMTEAQNLDLASGYRARTELGVDISKALKLAGLEQAASLVAEWAQQRQSDSRSVIADITVSAISAPFMFGFEIGPSFRGKKSPGSAHADAGRLLDRQSFPVVVAMVPEPGDLEPLLVDVNGGVAVYEPCFELLWETEWQPLTRWAAWSAPKFTDLLRSERILADAKGYLSATNHPDDEYSARRDRLATMIHGGTHYRHFPMDSICAAAAPAPTAKVARIEPPVVPLVTGQPTSFRAAAIGSGLTEARLALLSGPAGVVVTDQTASTGFATARLEIPAQSSATVLPLTLGVVENGKLLDGGIQRIEFQFPKEGGASSFVRAFHERSATGLATVVTFTPGLGADTVNAALDGAGSTGRVNRVELILKP